MDGSRGRLDGRPDLADGRASPPSTPQSDRFGLRLGFFYAAMLTAVGVQMPFFPVWLEAKGLDAAEIGLVLASPMIVRFFAVPMISREADRRGALRGALIAASLLAAAATAALGFAEAKIAIFAAIVIASIGYTACNPLSDAYAMKGLTLRRYGPVRLWGSAAFIAGNLGAGFVLDLIAPGNLIWLIAAPLALSVVAAFALAPLPDAPAAADAPRPSSALLFKPVFLAAVAAAGLIQASHALYYGFSTLDWRAAGLSGEAIGALWALGVVSEIVLFAFAARLPSAIGPMALIGIGAAGAAFRWAAMAFDPPAIMLPLLQCLHGLSFGATHLGSVGFLSRAAPAGLGASAQGYFSTALGIVMAVVMAVTGGLFEAFDTSAYAAMALIAAAGGGFALLARRLWSGGVVG